MSPIFPPVIDHIDYGVYGNVIAETSPSSGDRWKYAGREYDAVIQEYYNRARWYDPAMGRFIGVDPAGFAGGDTNDYRYGHSEPTNFRDPMGLQMSGGPFTFPGYSPAWRDPRGGEGPPIPSKPQNPWEPTFVQFVTYPFRWFGDKIAGMTTVFSPSGSEFAQELYARALDGDSGYKKTDTRILRPTDPAWLQITGSREFKDVIDFIIKPKLVTGGSGNDEAPIEFTEGPLFYAIYHATIKYTYTPSSDGNGTILTVKLVDIFDFDRFMTGIDDLARISFTFDGSLPLSSIKRPLALLANDFSRLLQFAGCLVPFEWETQPVQIYVPNPKKVDPVQSPPPPC